MQKTEQSYLDINNNSVIDFPFLKSGHPRQLLLTNIAVAPMWIGLVGVCCLELGVKLKGEELLVLCTFSQHRFWLKVIKGLQTDPLE